MIALFDELNGVDPECESVSNYILDRFLVDNIENINDAIHNSRQMKESIWGMYYESIN